MVDDQNKTNTDDSSIDERPLDPSGNYGDMIGDTSGQTGVTVGSAQQTSAEPSDTIQDVDTAHLPGGIQSPTGQRTQPTGIPLTAQNNKAYNQSVGQTMSPTAAQAANDIGTYSGSGSLSKNPANDSLGQQSTDQAATQTNTPTPPNVQGEQSMSGTTPDPDADNDTLENAHEMGQQMAEDTEHPQELDVARDVDKAEEYIRTH